MRVAGRSAQFLGSRGHIGGGGGDFADDGAKVFHHAVEGFKGLSDFVSVFDLDGLVQIAFGDGLGEGGGLVRERTM